MWCAFFCCVCPRVIDMLRREGGREREGSNPPALGLLIPSRSPRLADPRQEMPNQIFALLALLASVASASFAPSVHARHGRTAAAAPCRPPLLQRSGPLQPLRSPPVVAMARCVFFIVDAEQLIPAFSMHMSRSGV